GPRRRPPRVPGGQPAAEAGEAAVGLRGADMLVCLPCRPKKPAGRALSKPSTASPLGQQPMGDKRTMVSAVRLSSCLLLYVPPSLLVESSGANAAVNSSKTA